MLSWTTKPTAIRPELDAAKREQLSHALERMHELPQKSLWPLVAFLRTYERFADARSILELIDERDGRPIRWLEEAARVAFAEGKTDEALELIQTRIEQAPSATAQIALARIYLESRQLAKATEISDELTKTRPDLMTVLDLAADVALENRDREAARSHYLALVDLRAEHPGALLALSRLAVEEGDDEVASEFVRRGLAALAAFEFRSSTQLVLAAEVSAKLDRPEHAARLRDEAASLERARGEAFFTALAGALEETPGAPAPARTASSESRLARRAEPAAPLDAVGPVDERDIELSPQVLATLRDVFGFESLRPGQARVMANAISGRDTIAVMPTGAGKSLTFQLPAMLRDGLTLVISPLVALMKDQVESLPADVQRQTRLINSTLSSDGMREALDEMRRGDLRLVYVAPERLRNHSFLRTLRGAKLSAVVIDEAHCISMWGHDFRPDYLFIPRALEEMGSPPVLAITATATPKMVQQIGKALDRDLDLVRASVFRSNLFYQVRRVANREQKIAAVLEIAKTERGMGIVYVSSRKDAELIANLLRDRGVAAVPYHAGLDADVRARNQERFMAGETRVVVATVAFGMGVDKSNVRFIIHVSPPRSLEAYAQESGRAGRDGAPAKCILLFAPTDQAQLTKFIRRDEMGLDSLRRAYATIRKSAKGQWAIIDPSMLRSDSPDDDEPDMRLALGLLDQANLLRRHPDSPMSYTIRLSHRDAAAESPIARLLGDELLRDGSATIQTAQICAGKGVSPIEFDRLLGDDPAVTFREGPRGVCLELLPAAADAAETMQTLLKTAHADAERRVQQVFAYCQGKTCRHAALAAHLGEHLEACGVACDVCTGSSVAAVKQEANPRSTAPSPTADAFAALQALKTIPFSVGKAGLVKLLTGSVESRIRADRSSSFGALKHLTKSRVDSLVEQLVEDGFIVRDTNSEYRLLSLTEKGASADANTLAAFGASHRPTPWRAANEGEPAYVADGDGEAKSELLESLFSWRKQRAANEAVPPYVVAHNSMLQNLAISRPATKSALLAVPGFGPARVEKYGDELLSLIAENAHV